jgi:mannose/fructose/N-acetylgalactosamine-specific phosphotransferase system component IIC
MDLTHLVLVALAGGVLALDATSAGQFMVSRPLVAGTLTGWLVGDPSQGLLIGALLELYLLVSFPVGGARFPEGPTATVVAVATAVGGQGVGAVPVAMAVGLIWGQIGGWTITKLRRLNGRLVPEPGESDAGPRRVVTAHLGALGLDFLRGVLVTFTGVLVGALVVDRLAPAWPLSAADSLGLLIVGGAVSCGILLRSLGGFRRRKAVFAVGMALGLAFARFL